MNTLRSNRKTGILQILLSGFCFGFLGIFGKLAYSNGMQPGEFLSLRFLLGGFLLGGALLAVRPKSLRLSLGDILICSLLGLIGYAVFSSFYFQALKGLSASLTVMLLYTYPVMVAAASWLLFGQKIHREKWVALPLTMGGLMMLIWGDFQIKDPTALLFGLGSAVFYSVYILISSHFLKRINALAAVTYIQLAAGAGLSLVHWRDPARLNDVVSENWPLMLAVALICSVAAMSLFLAGLKKLKNWEASVLNTSEPVTGILLAMLVLNESFGWLQVAGALAVLGACVVVALPARN